MKNLIMTATIKLAAHKRGLLSALVAIILGGCATGFQATYDHDPTHDFGAYRTFAWVSAHPMVIGATNRIPNPLLEPRIMDTVERSLRAKGYRKVADPASADFVMAFTVGSREEIRVDSYPTMAGRHYPGRWGGGYYGYGTDTTVRQYTQGMLALDIFDVSERRPVWHGVATKKINESDRENMQVTIDDAVGAILAGFPP